MLEIYEKKQNKINYRIKTKDNSSDDYVDYDDKYLKVKVNTDGGLYLEKCKKNVWCDFTC